MAGDHTKIKLSLIIIDYSLMETPGNIWVSQPAAAVSDCTEIPLSLAMYTLHFIQIAQ